ncbi:hypothetical protein TcYC6_0047600 [Trypanosoma cruzi]|nr:hypothetical protein TcYC6_0005170 [Trypanosoma cruzi]KAF8302403.1 hypothetical protein TcYC6_0047600 [Trypanosoma cruzi]
MDTPSTHQPLEYQLRRAASGGNARFAENVEIFTYVQCGALPLQQRTVRIPPPTHRSAIPGSTSAAQFSRCGQRQLRAVAGTHNRCHPLILRVGCGQCDSSVLPSPSPSAAPCHQCRRSLGASSQPSRSRRVTTTDSAAARQHHVSIGNTSRTMPSTHRERLQALPVANGGAIKGPSSGCTSIRSACSLKAAGTTSSRE